MRRFFIIMNLLLIAATTMQSCKQKTNESLTPDAPSFNSASQTSARVGSSPMQVYGVWHAGNDGCGWATVRTMSEFDAKNHWLIDRGNGLPSVNLVVLSFVNPLSLLNQTTDAATLNGIPRGMTQDVVDYFKSRNIRVMLSIGGITYVDGWNTALNTNPRQLALNAASVAQQMGVGIEIDYEESTTPNIAGLQTFIDTYRSVLPYDATGINHAARLTIDLAAGDRWLIGLCGKAAADWLSIDNPVLDYANAMVPNQQAKNNTGAQSDWQEHISGMPKFAPAIPGIAPCKFTGAIWLVTGTKIAPECNNFAGSLISSTGTYITTVSPDKVGETNGMLGQMFWAAETPSARRISTTPPNTCENGIGAGATAYGISFPMPALRQR